MKRVGFITPNDDFYQMEYSEVEDFCRDICLSEENKEDFKVFKKDYSYFSPYFDFVMSIKKYLFFNPLYRERKFLIFEGGAYYENDLASISYSENVEKFKEVTARRKLTSSCTTVSDSELGIKTQDSNSMEECMVDSNIVGMMSKTGTANIDGSHIITGATVLNQLLSKSSKISNNYYKYLREDGVKDETDAINYLVRNVGFLRVAGDDSYGIMIGNRELFTEQMDIFVDKCEKRGYNFYNVKTYRESMIDEYLEKLSIRKR